MASRFGRDPYGEYQAMSPPLREAIKRLHAEREKAHMGIGNHLATSCPMFHATGVGAQYWYHLSETVIAKLVALGWTEVTYTAFMDWYDDLPDRRPEISKEHEEFLNWFLSFEDL